MQRGYTTSQLVDKYNTTDTHKKNDNNVPNKQKINNRGRIKFHIDETGPNDNSSKYWVIAVVIGMIVLLLLEFFVL